MEKKMLLELRAGYNVQEVYMALEYHLGKSDDINPRIGFFDDHIHDSLRMRIAVRNGQIFYMVIDISRIMEGRGTSRFEIYGEEVTPQLIEQVRRELVGE